MRAVAVVVAAVVLALLLAEARADCQERKQQCLHKCLGRGFSFDCQNDESTCLCTGELDAEALFRDFKAKHNKHYLSNTEHGRRLAIFKANLALIEQLNELEEGSAYYGVTEFADMSQDEFVARRTGLAHVDVSSLRMAAELDVADVPDSLDWREKGAVTEVKNQGSCGSCWSFSTTGNIEGQWFLAGHPLTSLSEQHLVDCDKVDQGCDGGLPSNAYEYLLQNGGTIDTEASYPYEGAGGSCRASHGKVGAKISNWTTVSTNEDQIAAYVAAHGPVSIGINANPMQFYLGGVANPWFCNPKGLNHGVLIVGFGKDGSRPYWTIKNSWGPSWGEKGYYRILRGKGKCGLNTMVTSALV